MEIQGMLRGARALIAVTVFCWRVDAERRQMILICKYSVAVPCDWKILSIHSFCVIFHSPRAGFPAQRQSRIPLTTTVSWQYSSTACGFMKQLQLQYMIIISCIIYGMLILILKDYSNTYQYHISSDIYYSHSSSCYHRFWEGGKFEK